MNLPAGVALLSVLSSLVHLAGSSVAPWLGVETQQQQCLTESMALQVRRLSSKLMCVGLGNTMRAQLAVQFNSDARQCSIFLFTNVRHLISGLRTNTAVGTVRSCVAFVNVRAADLMANTLYPKPRAAWIMGDVNGTGISSLVPDNTQQWREDPLGQYGDYTATLNVSNVDFGEIRQGFAFLFRIKLTVDDNYIDFESKACDATLKYSINVACYAMENFTMFIATLGRTKDTSGVDSVYCSADVKLDGSLLEFALVSASQNVTQLRCVFNSEIIGPPVYSYTLRSGGYNYFLNKPTCYRIYSTVPGLLRAVAIFNDTLTATEISDFFNQLPP